MRIILAILFSTVITNAYAVEKSYCAKSPPIKGACFTVHGKLFLALGTPTIRIWPVGTKRLLGVYNWGIDFDDTAPPNVLKLLNGDPPNDDPFATDIYGNYTVCPLEKQRKGWMRMVCMKSATHLRAVPR